MIRINRKTDYAIRVLVALAKQGEGAMLSTSQIHKEMLIPRALAVRVVAELSHGGFIVTHLGREGGLKLARSAAEINLRQVVTYFEENFTISECIHHKGFCPFEANCPVRRRWMRLQSVILQELESTTIETLAQEATETAILLSK